MKACPPWLGPPELPSTARQKLVEAQDTDWSALPGSMLAAADQVPPPDAPELDRLELAAPAPYEIAAAGPVDGARALVPLPPQAATASRPAATAATSPARPAPPRVPTEVRCMLVSPQFRVTPSLVAPAR